MMHLLLSLNHQRLILALGINTDNDRFVVCCLKSDELYFVNIVCVGRGAIFCSVNLLYCLLNYITGGRMLANPVSDYQSGIGVYGMLCLVSRNWNLVFKSYSWYGCIFGSIFVRVDRSPCKGYPSNATKEDSQIQRTRCHGLHYPM
jgi:hypothetical protein